MSKYTLYYAGYNRINDQEQVGVMVSQDLEVWTRPLSGPVISLSFAGVGLLQTSNPCVLQKDGKYFMWFQGKLSNNTLAIFCVESQDGISWKEGGRPVLSVSSEEEGGFRTGFQHPHVIYDHQRSLYLMWFVLNKEKQSTIGYAESIDGIEWDIKNTSVLKPEFAWEGSHVLYPMVLVGEDKKYSLWYSGKSMSGKWSVGYATSKDGIAWEKNKEPIIAPYVSPQLLRRVVEFACKLLHVELKIPLSGVASPNVWREDGVYNLIPHEVGTHGRLYLPLYQSTDGINWQKKRGDILESVPMEDWDAFFQADPFIVRGSEIK
jgi:predicted GH43/DUF377 family glycosyl hydrolase